MKFEITEYKTIKTTIEIDAKSIKEVKELYEEICNSKSDCIKRTLYKLYYKGSFEEILRNIKKEDWQTTNLKASFKLLTK